MTNLKDRSTNNENGQNIDRDENNVGLSSALPQRFNEPEELPTKLDAFEDNLKLDIRAHQRTYDGAYSRTAIGSLAFSMLIIKLFSREFLPIGTIYTIYGCVVFLIGMVKAKSVDFYYNPTKNKEYFKTSSNSIILLGSVSLICYVILFVLVLIM